MKGHEEKKKVRKIINQSHIRKAFPLNRNSIHNLKLIYKINNNGNHRILHIIINIIIIIVM